MKPVYWVAKYAAEALGPGVRYERVVDRTGAFVAATGKVLTVGLPARPRRPVHFYINSRVERYLDGASDADAQRLGEVLAWTTSHQLTQMKYDPRVEGEPLQISIEEVVLGQPLAAK